MSPRRFAESIATELTVPESILLFCLATDTGAKLVPKRRSMAPTNNEPPGGVRFWEGRRKKRAAVGPPSQGERPRVSRDRLLPRACGRPRYRN
jgi:hypothetical protein